MIVNLYAVRDRIAEETGPIFMAKNDAIALRQTQQLLRSEQVTDPEDFELWMVGTYDTELMDIQKNLFEVVVPKITEVEDEQSI